MILKKVKVEQIHVSEIDKEYFESTITESEVLKSLKEMQNDKSPGTDGYTAEFYKYFLPDIKNLLINAINYVLENKSLSNEQKRGIITLIPKKIRTELN